MWILTINFINTCTCFPDNFQMSHTRTYKLCISFSHTLLPWKNAFFINYLKYACKYLCLLLVLFSDRPPAKKKVNTEKEYVLDPKPPSLTLGICCNRFVNCVHVLLFFDSDKILWFIYTVLTLLRLKPRRPTVILFNNRLMLNNKYLLFCLIFMPCFILLYFYLMKGRTIH